MKFPIRNKNSVFLTIILVFFAVFANSVSAQRPKKGTKKITPPIQSYPQIDPSVVSRDSDYVEGDAILPEQTQSEQSRQLTPARPQPKQQDTAQGKIDFETRQKRLMLNLEILTKAEERAGSLRNQVFAIMEKQTTIRTRLDAIEYEMRPEIIERGVAFAGTLRPEELRDARRNSLENEKNKLLGMISEYEAVRANLEQTSLRADVMVEKLRSKIERDIDESLATDEQQ